MMGNVTDKGGQQLHGIIPRAIAHIFQTLPKPASTTATTESAATAESYAVGMSYFEIYNEKVYDLLASPADGARPPLDVRETPEHATYVDGLATRLIASTEEALRWIERGNDNRRVAATAHNMVSSRSHGVIQVTVERKTAGGVTASRLSLVDLAGSERYDSATHGSASRDGKSKREEMSAINKSLNTLALVVNALTQQQTHQRATHIPYRNSTLTHLLKDSLGGHSKAAIVACINPSLDTAHESTNTLKWASNAKHVRNVVRREEERGGGADSSALIQSLHAEIERLKRLERVEKCKRYRVYELLPTFAMKVLEDTRQPDEEGHSKAAAFEECKEQPPLPLLQLSDEKVVGAASESDESGFSISGRSSADLSSHLHDTLLESTSAFDCTLDSSSSGGAASRRTQVAGVFSSPSRLRWKVVRETFSSDCASKPLDESVAGAEVALFSPASQRRLERAEEEYEQRRASWQREKERMRHARIEKRRESVVESERSIREAQCKYEAACSELDELKAAHEEERSAREEERQRLLHQLDTVEEQSADKDEEVGRLLNEVGAYEARILAMHEQYAVDRQSESEAMADCAKDIAALQRSVREAEAERLSLQQRIEQLQAELQAGDSVRERLQARITMLTLDMVSCNEQQQLADVQHRQQLQQLGDQVEQRQAELRECQEQLAAEQAEHAADKAHLQQVAERLQRQLDKAEKERASMQTQASEQRAQHWDELQAAHEELNEQLRDNERAQQAAVDKQRRAVAEQSEKMAALQAQLDTVQAQLAALQATQSAKDSEHRADRIRLLQQFDAQLHAEQQRHRSEQSKSDTALQRRRQVETAVIDQIHSRHQQQLHAAEAQATAAKEAASEQEQAFQALAEERREEHERRVAAIQQQHEAELTALVEASDESVEAMRVKLQWQVEAVESELATARAEAVQQRSYQQAEMAFLEQRLASTAAALRAEHGELVASLNASHEQASAELHRQLAEQREVCERLQSHILLVDATLAELRLEAEAAQQRVEESERRVAELQATLASNDSAHKRQLEQRNVQLLSATYIACAAQTALKRRTAAYDAAAALMSQLREERLQLCDEMSALQVDMAAMQATHELQLDAKEEQLASRSNTIARLQGSGDESEADRVALHERIDQLQTALIDGEAHRQHLQARLDALQATIRQKDELLSIVQADAVAQRAVAEESRARQVAELNHQLRAQTQQHAAVQATFECDSSALTERLTAAQGGLVAKDALLATATSTLSAERLARREETFAHHVRVASLEQQLDITESARSDAADNLRQLAADKQQLAGELKERQQRARQLEAQLAEAITRRDAAEAEQKEVKAQCAARVRALEWRSAAALAEERSERYTELAATVAGYESQVARLEKRAADSLRMVDSANAQNAQLHDHIAALVEQQQQCSCEASQPGAGGAETARGDEDEEAVVQATSAQPQPASHGGVATRVIGVLRFVTFGFVTDSLGFCTR